jgi:hypothetical protein
MERTSISSKKYNPQHMLSLSLMLTQSPESCLVNMHFRQRRTYKQEALFLSPSQTDVASDLTFEFCLFFKLFKSTTEHYSLVGEKIFRPCSLFSEFPLLLKLCGCQMSPLPIELQDSSTDYGWEPHPQRPYFTVSTIKPEDPEC